MRILPWNPFPAPTSSDDSVERAYIDARHQRARAYELLNRLKLRAFQTRQGISGWKSPTFCERQRKPLSHWQISREPQRPSCGRVAGGDAGNCQTHADALLTALLTTVKRQRFSRNLVRNSILNQGLQWAVQDLNLRPLACHAHISCSPVLSDVQISANRSTFCPLRFAGARSNFLALLTALLTENLCILRNGSSTSIRKSYRKKPISPVEARCSRLDLAPSATASATASASHEYSCDKDTDSCFTCASKAATRGHCLRDCCRFPCQLDKQTFGNPEISVRCNVEVAQCGREYYVNPRPCERVVCL